nr:immunoglobulin light chain junction region [Macaca mulatta]MOV93708.1 immunoglobulin light chain junction region [Macaca mulatta]
CLQDTQLPQTF